MNMLPNSFILLLPIVTIVYLIYKNAKQIMKIEVVHYEEIIYFNNCSCGFIGFLFRV